MSLLAYSSTLIQRRPSPEAKPATNGEKKKKKKAEQNETAGRLLVVSPLVSYKTAIPTAKLHQPLAALRPRRAAAPSVIGSTTAVLLQSLSPSRPTLLQRLPENAAATVGDGAGRSRGGHHRTRAYYSLRKNRGPGRERGARAVAVAPPSPPLPPLPLLM